MKDFIELETRLVVSKYTSKTVALVCPYEKHSLLAVDVSAKKGYIEPILVGDEIRIRQALKDYNVTQDYTIIDIKDDIKAAQYAVSLVNDGQVDLIMKGFIQSSDLLKVVVNHEHGIRAKPLLSHVALIEVPYQDTVYFVSDGGMVTYPSFDQKKAIIANAIEVAHALGLEHPKVALLDAAEHTNPRILSSFESRDLSNLDWGEALVEGPISIDVALSEDAAKTKKYKGEIKGDANILIVPDIISGNILGKVSTLWTDGLMAGIVYGAKVPIILGSRGSTQIEHEYSIIVSCLIAHQGVTL